MGMCSAVGGRRCSGDGGSFIVGEVFGIHGLDARPRASTHDLEREHKGKLKSCGAPKACDLPELKAIKELHLRTIDELGLDSSIVSGFLDELEQLLKGVAMMKELTLRTRDYLVSFGECMSTKICAAYLNKIGKKAQQMLVSPRALDGRQLIYQG